MPTTSRRAAVVVGLSLALSAAVMPSALADVNPPAPYTPACTALVDAQVTVQTAQGLVNAAVATLATDQSAGAPAGTITTDQTAVDTLTARLAVLKRTTAGQICTGTTTGGGSTTTTTVTPAPSTTTVVPAPSTTTVVPEVTVVPKVTTIDPVNPAASDGSKATGVDSAAVPTGSVNTGYWG